MPALPYPATASPASLLRQQREKQCCTLLLATLKESNKRSRCVEINNMRSQIKSCFQQDTRQVRITKPGSKAKEVLCWFLLTLTEQFLLLVRIIPLIGKKSTVQRYALSATLLCCFAASLFRHKAKQECGA